MLTVAGTTRVFVATTPVDLRGSFNRLYSLVVEHLKCVTDLIGVIVFAEMAS